MRLSPKISLSFLPGLLIASVAIGAFIYPSLEKTLRKPVGDNHLLIAQQMMGTIDRVLHDRYNDIQIIAGDEVFLNYLKAKSGGTRRAVSNKINSLLELSGPWDVLMLVSAGGRIMFSSDRNSMGRRVDKDENDSSALRRALKGATSYSDLVLSRSTGKPTVIFAAPLVDTDDPARPIRGAVMGHFSWPVILELLGETQEAPVFHLYNKAGVLIGSSDPRLRAAILRRSDRGEPSLRLALKGKIGADIAHTRDGVGKRLIAHVPQLGYLNYKGSGWALTVETPLELAFAATRRFLLKFLVILSSFIGLSVLASNEIIRRFVSKPLNYFISVVREISRGDMSKRIDLATEDEIGELAAAFNRMVVDLNETTVSKEALQDSEERVRLLLDSAAEGIYGVDLHGNCTFANDACLKLLGFKRAEELLGREMHRLIHIRHSDEASARPESCSLHKVLEDGIGVHVEDKAFRRADGTSLRVECRSRPINKKGRTVGGVVSFSDITERKKLELMLVQSEKLSAVGQLAAGVAHEINNPLGIILGFAQSARAKIRDSDALSLPIKSIEREALRCRNLVQDLLTFSRDNKSRMEKYDLNEAVESTLSIIEAQAKVSSVEIVKDYGVLSPLVGDKNKIQQVIINLCSNAIDAMPNGGRILVRTRMLPAKSGEQAVLEIEDIGSGIPEEIRDKIFNPFFTTKEAGKGTGLGLSLVYEIVRRHQGEIQVKSEVGTGSTFSVSLPLKARDTSNGT